MWPLHCAFARGLSPWNPPRRPLAVYHRSIKTLEYSLATTFPQPIRHLQTIYIPCSSDSSATLLDRDVILPLHSLALLMRCIRRHAHPLRVSLQQHDITSKQKNGLSTRPRHYLLLLATTSSQTHRGYIAYCYFSFYAVIENILSALEQRIAIDKKSVTCCSATLLVPELQRQNECQKSSTLAPYLTYAPPNQPSSDVS